MADLCITVRVITNEPEVFNSPAIYNAIMEMALVNDSSKNPCGRYRGIVVSIPTVSVRLDTK